MKSQVREVPRLPKETPPTLSLKMRTLLTTLCFRENSLLGPTDAFLSFGTNKHYERQAKAITDFLDQGYTTQVILTGGRADYTDIEEPIVTESLEIFSHIDYSSYPDVRFFLEKESRNTLENVLFAQQVFDFSGISHLTFSCQSFAAGRCYLTLRRFFPSMKLSQSTFDVESGAMGLTITKDNWYLSENGIKNVWGEYLRICHYGKRGDIAFDEVKDLIEALQRGA